MSTIQTITIESKNKVSNHITIVAKVQDEQQARRVKKQIVKALAEIRKDSKRAGLKCSWNYLITSDQKKQIYLNDNP